MRFRSTIIVAFKGSETYENWLSNGVPWIKGTGKREWSDFVALRNVAPEPAPHFPGVIAHRGWALAVNRVFGDIVTEMRRQNAKGKTVIVSGHSLGGALSGYFTYRLIKETDLLMPAKAHRLITFAAPHYVGRVRGAAATVAGSDRSFQRSFDGWLSRKNLSLFRTYAVEMHDKNGVPDPITISWQAVYTLNPIIGVSRYGQLVSYRDPSVTTNIGLGEMAKLGAMLGNYTNPAQQLQAIKAGLKDAKAALSLHWTSRYLKFANPTPVR